MPAEDILDDGVPTADASREWLPHRNLCVEDKVAIATDQELNDKVIDACQAILKQKKQYKRFRVFTSVSGQRVSRTT